MDNTDTLLQALRRHVAQQPERVAFTFLADGESQEQRLTAAELDSRACSFAAVLQQRKLAGERVLVCCPPGPEFVVALWACIYAGAVATPCYPLNFRLESRAMERLAWLCQAARPKLAITSINQLDKARWYSNNQHLGLPWLAEGAATGKDTPTAEDWQPPPADPQALALLQYTSGSTAQPKGVMLSHANLLANIDFISNHMGLNTESVCVSWLPPYHDMGLIGATLTPIVTGFATVHMAPTQFLARPRRWLAAISRYRGTISPAPNFAYDYCVDRISKAEHAGLDLSTWSRALNGAEPVRARTLTRFAAHFSDCHFSSQAFVPCYGMAEASLLIAASKERKPKIFSADSQALARGRLAESSNPATAVELVSCGDIGQGGKVAVVDADSQTCLPNGHVGEIWLQSASVAQSYWQNANASQATFDACPNGESGKWLRTGDLGAQVDGELYVTGRLKDLIIIRGRNFHPTDLEQYASACHPALAADGTAAIAVAGVGGERLIILQEIGRDYFRAIEKTTAQFDTDAIAGSITQALLERFDVLVEQVCLLRPGSLPRTTSGKLRRADSARQYAQDSFAAQAIQPVAPAKTTSRTGVVTNTNPWQAKLSHIINEILRQPQHPLPGSYCLADLGLDSLKRMELAVAVETELDLALDLETYTPEITLAALADCLQAVSRPAALASYPVLEVTGSDVPLMPLQRQFLHLRNTAPQRLVTVAYLRTPADVDAAALQDAIAALAYQFDALRLRFSLNNGSWRQSYVPAAAAVGYTRMLANELDAEQRLDLRKTLQGKLYTEFDLQRDPPAQAIWLDRGAGQTGILAVRLHHLINDGTSQIVLVNTLEQNYRLLTTEKQCPIAPAQDNSFGAWARGLDAVAHSVAVENELAFWRQTCGDAPEPKLPGEPKPPETGKKDRAGTGGAGLDAATTRRFEQRYPDSATQYAAIITAAASAWYALSGQDDLLLELENHGRHAAYGLKPTTAVGWMVCHHPLRLRDLSSNADATALANVQTALAAMPNGGLGYGLLHHTRGLLADVPVPRVTITHRGRLDESWRDGRRFPVLGLGHEMDALLSNPERSHWRMLSQIKGGCLQLSLEYIPSICSPEDAVAWRDETVKRLLGMI